MKRLTHGGDCYRNIVTEDFSININPLGIPEKVKKAMKNCWIEMETYPDPYSERLKEKIAAKRGILTEHIILGNGASELIYSVIRAVNPKIAWIPIPSFSEYELALQACNTTIEYFLLSENDDFLMGNEMAEKIENENPVQPDMIIVCNPNNPNGRLIPPPVLRRLIKICKEREIYLIVDECFLELNGVLEQTAVQYIKDNPYLFVLDAFTKTYAIPGVRLGMGYSWNQKLFEDMEQQMPPWNISGIAQLAGRNALEETEYLKEAAALLKIERVWMTEQLKQLGCRVFHSDANYILFQSEKDWKSLLLEQKILIRDCANYRGLRTGFYRAAVKTREKNRQLIEQMKQL